MVKIFHKWKKIEYKMVDFSNHRKIYSQMFEQEPNTSEC